MSNELHREIAEANACIDELRTRLADALAAKEKAELDHFRDFNDLTAQRSEVRRERDRLAAEVERLKEANKNTLNGLQVTNESWIETQRQLDAVRVENARLAGALSLNSRVLSCLCGIGPAKCPKCVSAKALSASPNTVELLESVKEMFVYGNSLLDSGATLDDETIQVGTNPYCDFCDAFDRFRKIWSEWL